MNSTNIRRLEADTSDRGGALLIKGVCVLSFDDQIGDVDRADILVEGGRIAAVERLIDRNDVPSIDGTGMIAIPGFVDSHRHMWEGTIRNLLPDATLTDYLVEVNGRLGPAHRAEDARIGTLVSALGALNAGVTTVLDWSHIQNTPEHTDAVIGALQESGLRSVFAYGPPSNGKGPWWTQPEHAYPGGIARLRAEHFNSDDQLLTLALAAAGPEIAPFEFAEKEWRSARDVGARIAVHVGTGPVGRLGKLAEFGASGILGEDTTYIHCGGLNETEWKMIADTGGSVSLSAPIEMQMGQGEPPVIAAVRHGLAPSLSVDVECSQPGDFFSQMRTVFALQRMIVNEASLKGEEPPAAHMTTREILRWATVNGANANGLAKVTGSLSVGKQADIVLLKADLINVMPLNRAYGSVVLGMDTSNIDTVVVGGKIVKRDGELIGVDIGAIKREIEAARDHVLSTAGYDTSPTAKTVCNHHTQF